MICLGANGVILGKILIQLLGYLAEQLNKLYGALAQQIQVITLDCLIQALCSITNSLHSGLEHCR